MICLAKCDATVVLAEKLGKSEYCKYWAIYTDQAGFERMGQCICHNTALPNVARGDVVSVVTYFDGKNNRFEFV